jgi:hypothetical protein
MVTLLTTHPVKFPNILMTHPVKITANEGNYIRHIISTNLSLQIKVKK